MEDQFSTKTHESLFTRKLDSSPKSNTVKEDRGKSICQLCQKDGAELLNSRDKQDLGQDYHTCRPREGEEIKGRTQGWRRGERAVQKKLQEKMLKTHTIHCIGLSPLQVTALGTQC